MKEDYTFVKWKKSENASFLIHSSLLPFTIAALLLLSSSI